MTFVKTIIVSMLTTFTLYVFFFVVERNPLRFRRPKLMTMYESTLINLHITYLFLIILKKYELSHISVNINNYKALSDKKSR